MRRTTLSAVAATAALLLAPAMAHAALFIDAKSFSTQEATPLARSTIATFSDDHTPGTPCSASGYTSTVDWGDGTPVQPATVTFRFGGDFTLCEFTVSADHKYAHFGVFTTTVSVSGGPQGHSGSDVGEITVADVSITGTFAPFAAVAATPFNGVVATFKDNNNLSQPGDFTSSIDWGDGTPVITGTIGGANGDFTVSGAHTYAAPGNYTVRTVFEHPTGPPAVAVGTVTVAGAPPAGGGGGGGGGPVASPLPTMRLLHTSLNARALRTQGLALRLSTGAASGRTLRLEVLRNGRHFANSTLRLRRTDGKVQTVRWRPSASLLRRLRPGAYALRIRVGKPAQTLTRPFRIAQPRR